MDQMSLDGQLGPNDAKIGLNMATCKIGLNMEPEIEGLRFKYINSQATFPDQMFLFAQGVCVYKGGCHFRFLNASNIFSSFSH